MTPTALTNPTTLAPLLPAAQPTEHAAGLDATSLLSTVAYATLGVALLILFAWAVGAAFRLDLRRELLEDQNPGLGIALAGGFIAVALIIGATIMS